VFLQAKRREWKARRKERWELMSEEEQEQVRRERRQREVERRERKRAREDATKKRKEERKDKVAELKAEIAKGEGRTRGDAQHHAALVAEVQRQEELLALKETPEWKERRWHARRRWRLRRAQLRVNARLHNAVSNFHCHAARFLVDHHTVSQVVVFVARLDLTLLCVDPCRSSCCPVSRRRS